MAVLILSAEAAVALGVAGPEYFLATGQTEVGVWLREDVRTGERLTYVADVEYSRRAAAAVELGETVQDPSDTGRDTGVVIRPGWSGLLGRLAEWAEGDLDETRTAALFQELADRGLARGLCGYTRRITSMSVEAVRVTVHDLTRPLHAPGRPLKTVMATGGV